MRPGIPFLVVMLAQAALLCTSCESTSSLVRPDGEVDGELLYRRRCAQCHDLYDPRDYSDAEWAANVAGYAPRAGIRPSWRPALIAWLQEANDVPDTQDPAAEGASSTPDPPPPAR